MNRILHIASRECGILRGNLIYAFCMIVFPVVAIVFFTTMMGDGQPTDMPVGVVDLDNTATSRVLIRKLDSFQSSRVVAHYQSVAEARKAIQQNKIYAFLYIPKGTADELLASRQPNISYYYSSVSMVAGSMLYKDLKTTTMLGAAAVGSAKLSALGKTEGEIRTFLQPITLDLHQISNPLTSYNVYLSTTMIPSVLMLFILLITSYSIGTEIKFQRSRQWLEEAGGNIHVAVLGKLLPQFLIFFSIFLLYEIYVYYVLDFPHPGGFLRLLVLALLSVLSCQAFGVFAFGLMPSLRMSMSICSLWGVLSFTTSGATYPIFAMNPMIQAMAQLFPLRHYYMIYQLTILNGFPVQDAWFHYMALCMFICLPVFVMKRLKRAMLDYVYIP